jgi:hypothetical protein
VLPDVGLKRRASWRKELQLARGRSLMLLVREQNGSQTGRDQPLNLSFRVHPQGLFR